MKYVAGACNLTCQKHNLTVLGVKNSGIVLPERLIEKLPLLAIFGIFGDYCKLSETKQLTMISRFFWYAGKLRLRERSEP